MIFLFAACLLAAVPHNLDANQETDQDTLPQKAHTVTPATNAESAKNPIAQDAPAPDFAVHFDPAAGTPPPPTRPKQVPMIVVVIVWLSIVTFWHLRKGRDPESEGR